MDKGIWIKTMHANYAGCDSGAIWDHDFLKISGRGTVARSFEIYPSHSWLCTTRLDIIDHDMTQVRNDLPSRSTYLSNPALMLPFPMSFPFFSQVPQWFPAGIGHAKLTLHELRSMAMPTLLPAKSLMYRVEDVKNHDSGGSVNRLMMDWTMEYLRR